MESVSGWFEPDPGFTAVNAMEGALDACDLAPLTTMPECTRVFIAIAIPEPLERELARLQAELAPDVPGCRWTSALPFHLTLAFLGDVPNSDLSAICQVVAASAASIEPFEIEVKGLGAFPSATRPRVIWAGVTAPNLKPLIDLQESIVNSLARIGHRPDDERFQPSRDARPNQAPAPWPRRPAPV